MHVWTTDEILKLSSVIVHTKLQGQPVRQASPDYRFQERHQTSILTEVRRNYPDLKDSAAMKLYYEARDARLQNDIPTMLLKSQQVAEEYWGYWPNTLWLAYALRVFGKDYFPQAELVFTEAEKAIQSQLNGKLPLDVVPTTEPVTECHLRELLSMLFNNHAEFYRVQGELDKAFERINNALEVTDERCARARRLLDKAGILAQKSEYAQSAENVALAIEADPYETQQQLEHKARQYPGFTQVVKEVH
ncbi:MAG: hypothetical protein WCO51_02480 [bacterium]